MAERSGSASATPHGGMTIRGRLLLLAASMLVPYVLLVVFGTYVGRQAAVESALAGHEALARQVAAQLESHVEQMQALLAAVDAAVSDDLAAGSRNDARLRVIHAGASRLVSAIGVLDLEGRIIASATVELARRAAISAADRDYFRRAVETRAFAIGAPVVSRTTGEWVLIMARPVLDAAQTVRAVIVVITQLDRLVAMLEAMRIGADTQITVATDRGLVVARAPAEHGGFGEDVSALPHFTTARSGGTFRGETTGSDGSRLYGASVPVRNAPWQVFYGMPYDTALAPVHRRLVEHLAIAALMLLAAAAAAWWVSRGLRLPILQLRRGVNALARGGLAHRVKVHGGGEIGELAADVNRMAEKLEEAEARLRSLAGMSSDFFWETDAESRFTVLEGDVGNALGVRPAEALGKQIWTLGLRVNGDLAAHLRTLEQRQPFRDVEFVRLDAERSIVLVLLMSGEPRFGARGEFLGYRGVARDLTERNRLEAAVRRAQERLRVVVDAVPALIAYVNRDRRFVFVNTRHDQHTGLTPKQTVGRTVREVFGEDIYAGIAAQITRALAGEEVEFERSHRLEDGAVRDLRIQYVPDRDSSGAVQGFVALITDVTEIRAAQRSLAESKGRFHSLFEVAQEGMAIHRDGIVEQANSAMARLLGAQSAEALAGMHIADWVTPEYRDSVRERTALLQQGGERIPYLERKLLRLDGTTLDVEMGGASFMEGGVARLTIVVRDLSARKAHERQIMELNADLERRVAERTGELTAAYREMESFSYSVSHDLRAPLRAISAFSRILMEDFRGEVPAEAQRLLTRVAQNAERLGALIEGLLEFGRLARQPLRKQRIIPADLAREVFEEQASARAGREVEIRVGDMPECLADRALLKRVYANLISNALKYTRLRKQARIEVGAITMGLGPVYYVRDNGAGFDMADSSRLFDLFERLHAASEFDGHGVGLALVRRIVERHGGTVWADSAPDRGATFFFRLGDETPIARSADGKAAA